MTAVYPQNMEDIYNVQMTGHERFFIKWKLGRKMARRLATTSKAPIAPGVLKETKLHFQRKIKQLQSSQEIPDDLILNVDQTPLPYVCSSNPTLLI